MQKFRQISLFAFIAFSSVIFAEEKGHKLKVDSATEKSAVEWNIEYGGNLLVVKGKLSSTKTSILEIPVENPKAKAKGLLLAQLDVSEVIYGEPELLLVSKSLFELFSGTKLGTVAVPVAIPIPWNPHKREWHVGSIDEQELYFVMSYNELVHRFIIARDLQTQDSDQLEKSLARRKQIRAEWDTKGIRDQ